ncbi:MAG: SpoIIE family protein phosphatase [Treponema sp.]|nr:SpoIIE family protein phosphatase [Treponema sp.]
MKIITIRAKIILIVLAFLAAIGSVFFIYSLSITENYKTLRLSGIKQLVDFEAEKINKIIAEIERSAIFYALGGRITYETGYKELGEMLSVEYLSSFPVAVGAGFWFEPYEFNKKQRRAGFYAFYDKKKGKIHLDDTFLINEYDYHNQNWYREIIDNLTQDADLFPEHKYRVAWTKPYVDDTGSRSLMVTAGAGVFNEEGKIIAISTVDWDIDDIVRELVGLNFTKNSFVLICEPNKDYVVSCTRANVKTGSSVSEIPWDIFEERIIIKKTQYINFSKFLDNGALINIYIPENEMYAEVEERNELYSLLIAVSAFIMLSIAYILIASFINKPIKKLTAGVANIALGNLDTRIYIETNDEIAQLADTFNKMTSDLKNSIEENIREREEKNRANIELSVANEIQAGMLPNVFPAFPGRKEFDLYANMLPAKIVGGDFYDFFLVNNDNLVFLIADVSGKGVPAALFMVIAKTLIKNTSFGKKPREVFDTVNAKLCENNDANMFVTAFMGVYNIPTGVFTFVNAGHNPPLLKKGNEGFSYLKTEPSLVLAFSNETKYKQEEIILEKDDVLFLYTDGVTEAMNANNELFGEERLAVLLNQNKDLAPKELVLAVKQEVDNFCGGAEQADDITMLAFLVNDRNIEGDADMEELADIETIKELEIEANIANMDQIFAFLRPELIKCGFSDNNINEIGIAVEEIFMNISKYAYPGGSGSVIITISASDKVIISFEDTGIAFDPMQIPAPDLETPPETREVGGLGFHLVKKIMDTVTYARVGGNNLLVITKKLP